MSDILVASVPGALSQFWQSREFFQLRSLDTSVSILQ